MDHVQIPVSYTRSGLKQTDMPQPTAPFPAMQAPAMNSDFNNMVQTMQVQMQKQMETIQSQMNMPPFPNMMPAMPPPPVSPFQPDFRHSPTAGFQHSPTLNSPNRGATPTLGQHHSPPINSPGLLQMTSPKVQSSGPPSPCGSTCSSKDRLGSQSMRSSLTSIPPMSPSPVPMAQSPQSLQNPGMIQNPFPTLHMPYSTMMPQGVPNYIVQGEDGKKKVHMQLDVAGYNPDEINVKTDGNVLEVNAKHEQKAPNTVTYRSFHKHVEIPENMRMVKSKVAKNYDPNGTLTLEGPLKDKHRVKWAAKEREEKLYLPDRRDYIHDYEPEGTDSVRLVPHPNQPPHGQTYSFTR